MDIPINEELLTILREIHSQSKSEEEWAAIESSDMFQSASYDGGYDATEQAFCFSYYAPDGMEYWFQLTLDDIAAVLGGGNMTLKGRAANS
jgi:hypothetical protein